MHHAAGATTRSADGLSPARPDQRRWRRLRPPLLTAAAVAGATTLLATVSPHTPGQYGTCPSLWLMGVYCPGCGALRATADLAHLDLISAWSMNPLWVLIVPVLVLAWAAWLTRAWRGRHLDLQPAAWMWVTPLVAVLVYAVLRNVPALAPWLAPGGVLP